MPKVNARYDTVTSKQYKVVDYYVHGTCSSNKVLSLNDGLRMMNSSKRGSLKGVIKGSRVYENGKIVAQIGECP